MQKIYSLAPGDLRLLIFMENTVKKMLYQGKPSNSVCSGLTCATSTLNHGVYWCPYGSISPAWDVGF